jgi:hypothetical protein
MKEAEKESLEQLNENDLRRIKLELEIRKLGRPHFAQPAFWFSAVSTGVALLTAALMVLKNSAAETNRKIEIANVRLKAAREVEAAQAKLAQAEVEATGLEFEVETARRETEQFKEATERASKESERFGRRAASLKERLRLAFADEARLSRLKTNLATAQAGLPGETAKSLKESAERIVEALETLKGIADPEE